MNNPPKRLELRRETLRSLQPTQLGQMEGGIAVTAAVTIVTMSATVGAVVVLITMLGCSVGCTAWTKDCGTKKYCYGMTGFQSCAYQDTVPCLPPPMVVKEN